MARVTILDERCKGCMLCTTVCPKDVLAQSDRFNQQGYKVVEVVDEESCTGCTACAMICPDYAIRVYKPVKPKAKAESKEAGQ
ncbi:4Fe-4S dicluster domain-containing protein [Oceanidesulfovibrio marinus]|uniref:(Fe-S)-binding protein n=1 Tax=Oceanidesulfovibrio marinus TaxID=370038 RepID=A0A6P1ZJV7_9BACT|nr:4Fe-4S dicluster domain-containing protein [Oceanidesulfovibrio marinus]QJT10019.1 4Fe-4S dicluster domain-containing protein [Oceanidesulfovibrio marinus]TVM35863.1 (Fe-S)-binding protein [Oceanidesulfovibrio marinus]